MPLAYCVTSAKIHDNKMFKPLIKKLGPGILETIGLHADKAYDSESNIETIGDHSHQHDKPEEQTKKQEQIPQIPDTILLQGAWKQAEPFI